MTENYVALQTALDEVKALAPEIKEAFVFKEDHEIIAGAGSASEEQLKKSIQAFSDIACKQETIGNIETLTIQTSDTQVNVTTINNLHITTLSSQTTDEKILKMLTHILIPTALKLTDQNLPEPKKPELTQPEKIEVSPVQEASVTAEPVVQSQPIPEIQVPFNPEPLLPEPPVNQFMIEKIGGLLVPSDTVRIDSEVIAKWHDLYGSKEIKWVHIETLEGKAVLCGFKPIKEASQNAKGIIHMPEKVLQALQTSKGKLVVVKPEVTRR